MKTKGMRHQLEALRRSNGREGYAYLMEQGTGKTWTALADAERLYSCGEINALFVIAPKGVHTNWVRREIPAHVDMPFIARAWRSGAGKRERALMEDLFIPDDPSDPPAMRVFAINIDALMTKDGLAFAQKFLRMTRALIAIDESSTIKNPDAKRTIRVMGLRPLAKYARIMSGTPITNAPADIFSQIEFLESGLLGTTSYRAFVAEYAELVDFTDVLSEDFYRNAQLLKRNPKLAYAQVVQKNADGSPKWKNLEKLQRLIEPHAYRVLKRDCLDLPEKIYQQAYFDLPPDQLRAYELMEEECRILDDDGELLPVKDLSALVKLQQITSGFVNKPDGGGIVYTKENARLDRLLELMEEIPGKVIIWARFTEELENISKALKTSGRKVVEYHGRVNAKNREIAVDRFQDGDADVFIGQPQAGGRGLTLTAATHVVYYSNDFNMETRVQSEDRAHRIGTVRNVIYTDLTATGTVDEAISRALQRKTSMAAEILGDRRLNFSDALAADAMLGLDPSENRDVSRKP